MYEFSRIEILVVVLCIHRAYTEIIGNPPDGKRWRYEVQFS
jgi:hypothetical protein